MCGVDRAKSHRCTQPRASAHWFGSATTWSAIPVASPLQGKVRWAMAGRDARKLEEVKSKLAQINPACKVRRWAARHGHVLATAAGRMRIALKSTAYPPTHPRG